MSSGTEDDDGLTPGPLGSLRPLEDYKPAHGDPSLRDMPLLDYEPKVIPKAVAKRLGRLGRRELRIPQPRITTPAWSNEQPIPGLLIALRSTGRDAFGCGRAISELDTAVRRANALLEDLEAGDDVRSWPMPTRPERGGLWLLDATQGSLDTLWVVYGSLVTAATSTPVSLASFASLAWTASRSARRIASRFRLRHLRPHEIDERPKTEELAPGDVLGTWQERTTKSLAPILQLAVENGTGLNFSASGPGGEVRFIVPPRSPDGSASRPVGNTVEQTSRR